jgi:hypothetical protein
VSRASQAPGQRSLQVLGWLARVGVSPLEPWGLVMGWRRTVTYDHARRLAAAGLVRMVRMTRGEGSLVVLTAAGAARAGYPASWAPRSVAPSTWAHASACAWVSAWLELRGHYWWSEREILEDAFWRVTCATATDAARRASRIAPISGCRSPGAPPRSRSSCSARPAHD